MTIKEIHKHCEKKLEVDQLKLDIDELTPAGYHFLRGMMIKFGETKFARMMVYNHDILIWMENNYKKL